MEIHNTAIYNYDAQGNGPVIPRLITDDFNESFMTSLNYQISSTHTCCCNCFLNISRIRRLPSLFCRAKTREQQRDKTIIIITVDRQSSDDASTFLPIAQALQSKIRTSVSISCQRRIDAGRTLAPPPLAVLD